MAQWKLGDVQKPTQRPGLYTRFITEAVNVIARGSTGIVACASKNNWGELGVVKRVNSFTEFTAEYGNTGEANKVVEFIFSGGASEVVFYRPTGAGAAKADNDILLSTVLQLGLEAKYEGTRLNAFSSEVISSTGEPIVVNLYDDKDNLIASWTSDIDHATEGLFLDIVAKINDDESNVYVVASTDVTGANDTVANNTLAANSGDLANFANGVDPTLVASSYTDAVENLEQEYFASIYFNLNPTDTTEGPFLTSAIELVDNWRDIGKNVRFVTGSGEDSTGVFDDLATANAKAVLYNSMGVEFVHPGARLLENRVTTSYAGYELAAHVAGLMSSLPLDVSPTFVPLRLPIVDLNTRYGNANIKTMIGSGVLALVYDGSKFKIERAINTLTVLGANQNNSFKKIKVVRILDAILNALNISMNDQVIGKYINDQEGRENVIVLVSRFLDIQANDDLISEDFVVISDPDNPSSEDRFFLLIGLKVEDSIEYIYNTIELAN